MTLQKRAAWAPTPVFSEVFILKGFKSCVLEVRILQELQARFSEVRIIRDLAICDPDKVGAGRRLGTGGRGRRSRRGMVRVRVGRTAGIR